MSTQIHPTAVVENGAVLGLGCTVAPLALVRAGAVLGNNNEIGPHCTVDGSVRMGSGNRLQPGASLGGVPQDLSYAGEPTLLRIGDDNWIGENVTLNRGTAASGETVVGDRNFLMANAHIGHDCRVGDDNVFANSVPLGGVVTVGNRVTLGGNAAVHQFCRIGDGVMVAGLCRVTMDVLPFTLMGDDNSLFGLNRVGLRRAGHKGNALAGLRQAFQRFAIRREPREAMLEWMADRGDDPLLQAWHAFLAADSRRGYARARGNQRAQGDGDTPIAGSD